MRGAREFSGPGPSEIVRLYSFGRRRNGKTFAMICFWLGRLGV